MCLTIYSFVHPCLLEIFMAMTLSGMRPEATAALSTLEPHWDSPGISSGCSVSWSSCSFGSVGSAPQALQQFIDGGGYWGVAIESSESRLEGHLRWSTRSAASPSLQA